MILMGLSIFAAIGLLVVTVWALHRYQQRKNEESVDRNLPLPPLELRETEVTGINVAEDILGIDPDSMTSPRSSGIQDSQDKVPPNGVSDQWLPISREHLSQGEFDAALDVCKQALPQMGAFRQACVVLRAQIRELKKRRKPYDRPLLELYQLAALADFFHAKDPDGKSLSPSAIKQIDFKAWQGLETSYSLLGFERIALLTKTDAKWFVQEWGEPNEHKSMRELNLQQWNILRNSLR